MTSPRRAAIAFDIDGVFKYGRQWSDAGLRALKRVTDAKMPYVFVTNGGGGLTEQVYGSHLKEKVLAAGGGSSGDIELPTAERMVLSYTPWESQLVPELVDKRVLLVGDPAEKVKEVAATYGLKYAVHYSDYAKTHSTVNPFRVAREGGTSHTAVANATVQASAPRPRRLPPSPFHHLRSRPPPCLRTPPIPRSGAAFTLGGLFFGETFGAIAGPHKK